MCTNVFVSPFEKAGLAPTVVRFCIERALQSTCQLTQQLHAISLDEPTFNASTTDCTGLFVMQWELEAMLVHLFGASADAQASRAPVLAFEDQGVHFPLEMMMSASWYLPFGDLSRLRMLVAQITRRHLNERKLAALNGCLHRQVLLLPHSARLQELLLELSVDTAPSPWSKERTRRMLELLSVQTTKSVLETIGDRLPALSPVTNVNALVWLIEMTDRCLCGKLASYSSN
ncbi:TPA: hypothetical protein N0F65_004224 [Lagenidium giganteum]|uniref:Uncharacterized protein n=1 Tax=Lagenidium giganteum TaxID=4803 RepID=A0AAV2ZCW1_9STRA|nr:TPA: hypothetical protein N0F65_004224 [Lagenidium giganteum]